MQIFPSWKSIKYREVPNIWIKCIFNCFILLPHQLSTLGDNSKQRSSLSVLVLYYVVNKGYMRSLGMYTLHRILDLGYSVSPVLETMLKDSCYSCFHLVRTLNFRVNKRLVNNHSATVCWHQDMNQGCFHCSVAQPCPTLCDPMGCSTPGFPVFHHLPESAQTHGHWVGDAIPPSHPLLAPSPPAFNLSYNAGLFQWFGSSPQVTKVFWLKPVLFLLHQDSLKIWHLFSPHWK